MNKLFSFTLLITCIMFMQTMNAYKYWIQNLTTVDLDVQVKVGTADRATQQQGTLAVPGGDKRNNFHGPIDIGGTGAGLLLQSVGIKPYGSKGDYSTMGHDFGAGIHPFGNFTIIIHTDGKYFWYDLGSVPPGNSEM